LGFNSALTNSAKGSLKFGAPLFKVKH